jgi:hypothetical protein
MKKNHFGHQLQSLMYKYFLKNRKDLNIQISGVKLIKFQRKIKLFHLLFHFFPLLTLKIHQDNNWKFYFVVFVIL